MTIPKIDIHVHTTMYAEIEMPRFVGDHFASPEEIRKKYAAWGIESGIILPQVSNECAFSVQSNEDAFIIAHSYSDLFMWFCNLSPRMGNNDAKTDFSEFIEHYKRYGAVGVGELTFNMYIDDPMTENLLYHCGECDMPALIHIAPNMYGCYGVIDDIGLPRLEKILKKYPKLRIIGHSQPFWAEISTNVTPKNRNAYPGGKVTEGRLTYLLREYDNLFCDMSAGSGYNAMVRDPDHAYRFMEEFQDRMMFGTDICAPHNEMKLSHWLDDAVNSGCISQTVYRKICRDNAIRIMKIDYYRENQKKSRQ
ncbi:MAG: amidohydrolase family protein [Eubacteriales bacterium]|nr:amidohydrolase family protein [Eubacteriales bacterium]